MILPLSAGSANPAIYTVVPRQVDICAEDEWHDCQSEIIADDNSIFAAPVVINIGNGHITPGELAALQQDLDRETNRPVDLALAAAVLQRIHDRTRPTSNGRPLSLEEKVRRITERDVRDFMLAAGLPETEISRGAIRQALAAGFASLATLPAAFLGTCLSSCIHAIYPGSDAARLTGFLLNVAVLAATPYIHASLLQLFGAQADIWRGGNYVHRINRRKLNTNCSKAELTDDLHAGIEEFRAAYSAARSLIGHADAPLSPAEIQICERLQEAVARIEGLIPAVEARRAADARVYLENSHQQLARYPKLVLAPVGQLLRAARWISAWAAAAFQMGASLGTSAFQAALAGQDDRAKQRFTLKYQMLEDAPLTDAGPSRLTEGQDLLANDVHPGRLRAAFVGPAEARVLMVAQCLRTRSMPQSAEVGQEIAALRADLARLEGHRLEDLALDGVAARLLQPGRWHDPLLWAEVADRFHRRGEMSTQFCKFLGQQWQMLIGPGYYVLVPKLLSVAAHGKPGLPGMGACVALAALLGIAGCRAHPEVAIERNEMLVRIDRDGAGPGFVDFMRNAGIALIALPRQLVQRRRFDGAQRRRCIAWSTFNRWRRGCSIADAYRLPRDPRRRAGTAAGSATHAQAARTSPRPLGICCKRPREAA